MLQIAIVDDEQAERENLRACLSFLEGSGNESFSVFEYSSAEEFLFHYDFQFDLVFMDIDFPSTRLNGLNAAKKLREIDQSVMLIFVTNLAQMAIQGYEVQALDFLVKPIKPYPFQLKMTRVLARIGSDRADNAVIVNDQGGNVIRINKRIIRALEMRGHYVVYHTKNGEYSERTTLLRAEQKLNDPAFFRCNRSTLVNLRFVTQVNRDHCVVDGISWPIARTQHNDFMRAYTEYLGGQRRTGGI